MVPVARFDEARWRAQPQLIGFRAPDALFDVPLTPASWITQHYPFLEWSPPQHGYLHHFLTLRRLRLRDRPIAPRARAGPGVAPHGGGGPFMTARTRVNVGETQRVGYYL